MYTIFVDGNLLYAPILSEEGYDVLNGKITYEPNKSGSLKFLIPPDNKRYNSIQKMKSVVTVYDGDTEIFRGRVLQSDTDFYKRKSVYCEGELAFLIDSVQRPYDYQGSLEGMFRQLITNHNKQVDKFKRFEVGQITVTDSNDYVHYSSTQYPSTWEEINLKLINTHGGYIRTRLEGGVRYIDYIQDYDHESSQIIQLGENIIDLSKLIDAEDVFTVLIPLGAKQEGSDERLTIESVNDGKDYIESEVGISLFGRITKTAYWDDVTLPQNLLTKGQEVLNEGIQPFTSLKLKAIDLHLAQVNVERIQVGHSVRVVSIPHGLDKLFQCTKITVDMMNPASSVYEFGVSYSSMTDSQAETMNADYKTAIVIAQQTAEEAQQTANKANSDIQTVVSTIIPDNYVDQTTFDLFRYEVLDKLNTCYKVKGSVPTFADLPTENEVGDAWNVSDTGANYVWTESGWDKLSEILDFVNNSTFQALVSRVSALEGRI